MAILGEFALMVENETGKIVDAHLQAMESALNVSPCHAPRPWENEICDGQGATDLCDHAKESGLYCCIVGDVVENVSRIVGAVFVAVVACENDWEHVHEMLSDHGDESSREVYRYRLCECLDQTHFGLADV